MLCLGFHFGIPLDTHMRFLPLLLIAISSASAQTDASKLLEQGLKQAVAGLAPVPETDKTAVLAASI